MNLESHCPASLPRGSEEPSLLTIAKRQEMESALTYSQKPSASEKVLRTLLTLYDTWRGGRWSRITTIIIMNPCICRGLHSSKSTSHTKLLQLIFTNKLAKSGFIIFSFTSRKMKPQPMLVAGSAYVACNWLFWDLNRPLDLKFRTLSKAYAASNSLYYSSW